MAEDLIVILRPSGPSQVLPGLCNRQIMTMMETG